VESLTVARVIELADVSRQTFYEHFADRSECLFAVLDEFVSRATERAVAAYAAKRCWLQRIRAGLLALLEFLDEQPELARACVAQLMSGGTGQLARREELLGRLVCVIDEGRGGTLADPNPSQPAARSVIGGTLGMIQARLLGSDQPPLVELLNPLMGMIVLPYLGEAAALRELSRSDDSNAPARRGAEVERPVRRRGPKAGGR
jgi:AcrR family transcriptional regulator